MFCEFPYSQQFPLSITPKMNKVYYNSFFLEKSKLTALIFIYLFVFIKKVLNILQTISVSSWTLQFQLKKTVGCVTSFDKVRYCIVP